VGRAELTAILGRAQAAGIDTLDTAMAYGDSEQRLGECGIRQWRAVTKLPELPDSCADVAAWARKSVYGSLAKLKLVRLGAVLLHRPLQLLGPYGPELQAALFALKDEGLVEKVGISIYGPADLDALWHRIRPELVQAPLNVLDRRLLTSGWMARMQAAGTEIHVRSVFLQGLLLMDTQSRPAMFGRWQPLWDQWARWLSEASVSPLRACLGLALSRPEVSRVVVGVDSLEQLEEVLAATLDTNLVPPSGLACTDADLLDPSRWALQ
jgi:aryl-alcohol dehydrogenase-like predicted oxidoreductase